MWNDTFVISANSTSQYTAELFLNFLLRPEINAMITNENYYATTNSAAYDFIEPDILDNPMIFPSNSDLNKAELVLPLSPEGQKLYDEIWERFTATP
jgi:spermidine/putrescine transport system substrate-binding protein